MTGSLEELPSHREAWGVAFGRPGGIESNDECRSSQRARSQGAGAAVAETRIAFRSSSPNILPDMGGAVAGPMWLRSVGSV